MDYARLLFSLAQHYRGELLAYELWNEPNHKTQCRECGVSSYIEVLRAGYLALKYVDPEICVLMGGLAENGIENVDPGTVPDYLASFLTAGGGDFTDVISIHPYFNPWAADPESDLNRRINDTRIVMEAYGIGEKPLWITETGWPSGENGITLEKQAELLTMIFSAPEFEGTPLSWYRFEDRNLEQEPYNFFTNSGLVRHDLSPKPAYFAFLSLSE
jgi:hypothetical protein